MTDRWQYGGIRWLSLISVKSLNVTFLNQICYISTRLSSRSSPNPLFKVWKCRKSNHDLLLIVRHANNDGDYHSNNNNNNNNINNNSNKIWSLSLHQNPSPDFSISGYVPPYTRIWHPGVPLSPSISRSSNTSSTIRLSFHYYFICCIHNRSSIMPCPSKSTYLNFWYDF